MLAWQSRGLGVGFVLVLVLGFGAGYAHAQSDNNKDVPRRVYVQVYPSRAVTEPERVAIEAEVAAGAQAAQNSENGREIAATEIVRDVRGAVDPEVVEEALGRSDRAVREGARRLRELDLDGTLNVLEWAEEEYANYLPELVSRDRSAERLVDVYLQQTVVHYLNGDEETAAISIRRALQLDPNIAPNDDRFPPQLGSFVRRQRRRVRNAGNGSVRISVADNDNWAVPVIYVNGVEQGTAPLVVKNLPAGSHWVHARLPGAVPFRTEVEVASRDNTEVSIGIEAGPRAARGPLAALRRDVGQERATQAMHDAARALEVDGLILVIPIPTAEGIDLVAHVYDMRSGELVGRVDAKMDRDRKSAIRELGWAALTGARWGPLVDTPVVAAQPLWKNAYFWTAVGAVTGIVVAGVVIAADTGLSNGQKIVLFPAVGF